MDADIRLDDFSIRVQGGFMSIARGPATTFGERLREFSRSSLHSGGAELGTALVLLATLGFAFKGIFARVAFARGLPSETILLLRVLMAAPLFALALAWARRDERVRSLDARHWLGAAGVGLLFMSSGAADFFAIERIGAGPSRVILFSHPALVLAYQALRARRAPSRTESLAFVGAWLGLWLAAGMGPGNQAHLDPVGIAFALGSAVGYAAYLLASQRLMERMGSVAFISTANLAGAMYVVAIEASLGLLPAHPIPGPAWAPMVGLVLVSTVLPALLFTEGLRRLGASRASLLSLVGPPATVAAAALILGERMSATQLIGCAVVVISIARLKKGKPSHVAAPRGIERQRDALPAHRRRPRCAAAYALSHPRQARL